MNSLKIYLLIFTYSVSCLGLLVFQIAGIKMGLEHIVSPTFSWILTLLYLHLIIIGRIRWRYGFLPALVGMLVDVGLAKTALYFVLPHAILVPTVLWIIHYSSSLIMGKNKTQVSLPISKKLLKVINYFNPVAVNDAKKMVNLHNSNVRENKV